MKPPSLLPDRAWLKIKTAGVLPDAARAGVEKIVRAYRLDAAPALEAVDHVSRQISELDDSLQAIIRLKNDYYQSQVFLLNKTPHITEEWLDGIRRQLRQLQEDLQRAANKLRYRRGIQSRRTVKGPIRDLIRDADAFWIEHTGNRIQTKSKDPESWKFLSALFEVVEPTASYDTLKRYFRDYYEMTVTLGNELDFDMLDE